MSLRSLFFRSFATQAETKSVTFSKRSKVFVDKLKEKEKKPKHDKVDLKEEQARLREKANIEIKAEKRRKKLLKLTGFNQFQIADWKILVPHEEMDLSKTLAVQPQGSKPSSGKSKKDKPAHRLNLTGMFAIQKRGYATQAWTHVPSTLRLTEYLSDESIILPEGNFTTVRHALRNLKELREIYQGIGATSFNQNPYRMPRDIVVFNPERMALQYTGIVAATEIKSMDDAEYLHICKKLYGRILPAVKTRQHDFIEMEDECEALSHDLLRREKSFDPQATDPVIQQFLRIRRAVWARLGDKNVAPYLIDRIVQRILMDDMLREKYRSEVYDIVVQEITHEIHTHHLTALAQHTADDREQILLLRQQPSHQRLTKFISGGIATGKSSIAKLFAAEFKAIYGRDLSDFARINTDTFRSLLTVNEPLTSDTILNNTLAHDEARMMTDLSIELIGRKVAQEGYGPDVLGELVSPTDYELEVSTLNRGQVSIAWTSYPPDKAVEGNYRRFQDKQERLPPVSAVLVSQQVGSKDAPKIMNNHSGKDIVITLHNTYKIIHESAEGSALIAILHCQRNKVAVIDIHGMLDFVKKSHINTKATCPDTIYPEEKVSLQANIVDFLKDYGDKEIVFVDPAVQLTNTNEFETHAYAVYTQQQGLVIKNEEVFNRVLTADSVNREMFIALGLKPDYEAKASTQPSITNTKM